MDAHQEEIPIDEAEEKPSREQE